MSDQNNDVVKEFRSLPLHDIISGPLLAIIEAEAQAAKTSLDYIESVGFAQSPASQNSTEIAQKVGKLRMAEFTYKKQDENGQFAEFTASVPILSLVPIPMVQISKADISFSVKITDVETITTQTAISGSKPKKTLWQLPERTELRATMGTKGTKDEKIERVYAMDITVTVEKADTPVGLTKIFNLMDQAIQDSKAPK